MSLSTLLQKLQPELTQHISPLDSPWPTYTLFFSISDGEQRAHVVNTSADTLEQAWEKGADAAQALAKQLDMQPCWLRVDWVNEVKEYTWQSLKQLMAQTKRNYFRYGLALDNQLEFAFLEQELNANATLFMGNKVQHAQLNEKNFTVYTNRRYGKQLTLDFSDDNAVYRLSTQGVFCAENSEPLLLHDQGLNTGRRIIYPLGDEQTRAMIQNSSDYLAGQVQETGQFNYGWHPCFGRQIDAYNTLRHISTTYAMLDAWEVTQDDALQAAIERSLHYLTSELIKDVTLDDGTEAAFLIEVNNEIKLGGNAVSLLALTKYTELMGDEQYRPLLERLALGIQYMQDPNNGKFIHVISYPELTVKEDLRIIYYDGEATYGLMRLYALTQDERWLNMVEKAFDYLIKTDHWRARDHWLSHCINELVQYRPEERYYQFGIQNVADYLDVVQQRITTSPTLLELMMAAHKMVAHLKELSEFNHLLEQLDLDKFDRVLEYRAHYLMNGHFWPEYAMFFRNPNTIVGSFFIRHHAFRVRIDDVENYLSGYVAYLNHYLNSSQSEEQSVLPAASDNQSEALDVQPEVIHAPEVDAQEVESETIQAPEADTQEEKSEVTDAPEAELQEVEPESFESEGQEIESEAVNTPETETQEVETEVIDTPELEAVDLPEDKTQEAQAEAIDQSEVEIPEVEADTIIEPEAEIQDVESEEAEEQKIELEAVDTLEAETQEVETEVIDTPELEAVDLPEDETQEAQAETIDQSEVEVSAVEADTIIEPEAEIQDVESEEAEEQEIELEAVDTLEAETQEIETEVTDTLDLETTDLSEDEVQEAQAEIINEPEVDISEVEADTIIEPEAEIQEVEPEEAEEQEIESEVIETLEAEAQDVATEAVEIPEFDASLETPVTEVQETELEPETFDITDVEETVSDFDKAELDMVMRALDDSEVDPSLEVAEEESTSVSFTRDYSGGINWTASRLETATEGEWLRAPSNEHWRATGLCLDPSMFQPGQMVVAGSKDQQNYLSQQDIENLPCTTQAILTQDDWPLDAFASIPVLKVSGLDQTMLSMATYARAQLLGKVIGITGNTGKTTTLAMLSQALSPYGKVSHSKHDATQTKDLSEHIASMPWDIDFTILEMPVSDLAHSATVVRPDIAILINAGEAQSIFAAMDPGSYAIINRDMPEWDTVSQAAKAKSLRIISFGEHEEGDIRLLDIAPDTGVVTAKVLDQETSFVLNCPGLHMAMNALACLGATYALELQRAPAEGIFSLFQPLFSRGEVLRLTIKDDPFTVIDDTYSANPSSMKASLQALESQKARRKLLILGDMQDAYGASDQEHEALIPLIKAVNPRVVFLIGDRMEKIQPMLKEAGVNSHFRKNITMIKRAVTNYLKKDDLVLFKSSQGVGLHEAIEHLANLKPEE